MNNFDGYSEPVHNTQSRAWRIALASAGYPPQFTTEMDANAVSIFVDMCNTDPQHNLVCDGTLPQPEIAEAKA